MTAAAPPARNTQAADPVERFTRRLRELGGPGQPFDQVGLAALDRADEFPADACRALDATGLPRYYVPAEHGGALDDFTVVLRLLRAVARIDLTVAAAHGKTYLGAVPTWIVDAAEPARWLGRRIAAAEVVSCALTERHHGSDLLAGEVVARPAPDGGWLLDGEKWLINNVTRAGLVTVLARTDDAGGPRGFSLFLVDKARLAPGAHTALPKVPTYGIRGADISGIAFHQAWLPADALIGATGQGVEIIVKALHITRTCCAAMSLGVGDHVLRLAADFAAAHRAGGAPVGPGAQGTALAAGGGGAPLVADGQGTALAQLPHVRRELGEAAAGLLLAEATGLVAVRSLHALTGEMSVISAVAKAYVPAQVDAVIARLLHLLGPHGLLGPGDPHGLFAKAERDHRIIGIFDGSSLVNRNALIEQFPRIARGYRKGRLDADGLAEAADLYIPPRPFRPASLGLLSTGGCSVSAGLPGAVAELRERAEAAERADGGNSASLRPLLSLGERLLDATERLHEAMAAVRFTPRAVPAEAFDLAERYELCFAAAAALHLWLRGTSSGAGPVPDGWLRGCLVKALTDLGEPVTEAECEVLDELADHLSACPPGTFLSLLDQLDPRKAEAS
ncbi:acyl-CoA dehydrogenase family protein [Streptomyces sp. 1331.2]|uniref:acyl-CoA dehydrogenase family protein n=1 Tax=Streptomyces sp. 1331.2 TaxID=1938835 RepID=UPI000BC50DEA|nr:acyl-CoA dehydrogenase family protein [Streptomyces sp. 1331.2]SOB81290.1 Acyl-CoA dehydrogenase [Streptomyces sp. 1331.2]